MLRKTKTQSILNLFEGTTDITPDQPTKEVIASEDQKLEKLAEEQKSKKLGRFNPMISNGNSVLSATTGAIRNEGGPSKQINSISSNSIFEPHKNANIVDSKEATKKEKEITQTNRRTAERQRINDLIDSLKTTDQTKAASAFRTETGNVDKQNYKTSRNNMSIFDAGDFERLPEKTGGEQASEDKTARKNIVDDSWRGNGKSLKSSEINNKFFNSLITEMDKNAEH